MSIKAKVAAAIVGHMFLWLAMLIVLAGVLSFAWGVYALLAATALGAGYAAMIVGGGLTGLIVVIALIALIVQSAQKPSKAEQIRQSPDTMIEHQLRPMIGDRATNWAKANTGVAIVGALSAGVLLAASPRLRSLLVRATGPLVTRQAIQAVQRFSDQ